jgi:hypothetical protein
MYAFKNGSTVRYDNCGSTNKADYQLDQGPSQAFSSYVASNTGSTQFYGAQFQQVGGGSPGDDRPFIDLKPEIKQAIIDGKLDRVDDSDTVIAVSGWPFQAGGGDPDLGPNQFDGAYMLPISGPSFEDLVTLVNGGDVTVSGPGLGDFKPCSSDADCAYWGLSCRPSPTGLVCVR